MQKAPEAGERVHEEGAGVSWLELFFDLVLVAYIAYSNSLLSHSDGDAQSLQLGCFSAFALFTIWMITTLIGNRFPSDGAPRRALMILQMLFLVIAMLSFEEGGLLNSTGIIAFGAVYLCLTGMYVDMAVSGPTPRPNTVVAIAATTAAAAICLIGGAVIGIGDSDTYLFGATTAVASLVAIVPLVLVFARSVSVDFPIRRAHLDERWGQFTLIILGEGFLLIVELLRGRTNIPNIPVFVLVFFSLFGFWRLYFDSAMRVPFARTGYRLNALMFAQFLLLLGLLGSLDVLAEGVGVNLPINNDFLILGLGLALVFCALALATWARRGRIERPVIVSALLAVAFACYGTIGQRWHLLSVDTFIASCCVVILAYAALLGYVDPQSRRLLAHSHD